MNSSQLLYKISNLQYSIRRKEVEYSKAVKANEQPNIDLIKADLTGLKEDLDKTVKEFNSIPADKPDSSTNDSKKTRKWQNFFNLKFVTNKKQ